MLTKHQLITALLTGGQLKTDNVYFRIVNGVARESGSGHSFNVTGYVVGKTEQVTVYVRTLD